MTLEAHSAPITALDFSEPYGMLVTASQDESTRLWDLRSGEALGFLRGHSGIVILRIPSDPGTDSTITGAVRCLQVEQDTCVTGGTDGTVRLWDLRAVEDEEEALVSLAGSPRSTVPSIPDDDQEAAVLVERPSMSAVPRGCLRTFEGHTKGVSAVYFEESCLVSGASDKTLRQWDINTGQCVMTMDILWAISHPPPANPRQSRGSTFGMPGASLLSAASSTFAVPSPPSADGSWDMYQDFVGGVQFWGYALVSGSGDGAVRMWDSKWPFCIRLGVY
jgi:division protein 1